MPKMASIPSKFRIDVIVVIKECYCVGVMRLLGLGRLSVSVCLEG